jgi:hypothetical protein
LWNNNQTRGKKKKKKKKKKKTGCRLLVTLHGAAPPQNVSEPEKKATHSGTVGETVSDFITISQKNSGQVVNPACIN